MSKVTFKSMEEGALMETKGRAIWVYEMGPDHRGL